MDDECNTTKDTFQEPRKRFWLVSMSVCLNVSRNDASYDRLTLQPTIRISISLMSAGPRIFVFSLSNFQSSRLE